VRVLLNRVVRISEEAEVNKRETVDRTKFHKTQEQLEALYQEIGALSKKKPDDAVNKFKLGFVNRVLTEANTLLLAEYIPFPDFQLFDEDTLPTNSDIVLVLAQYLKCFERQELEHHTDLFI
jgi:hypothetical protein